MRLGAVPYKNQGVLASAGKVGSPPQPKPQARYDEAQTHTKHTEDQPGVQTSKRGEAIYPKLQKGKWKLLKFDFLCLCKSSLKGRQLPKPAHCLLPPVGDSTDSELKNYKSFLRRPKRRKGTAGVGRPTAAAKKNHSTIRLRDWPILDELSREQRKVARPPGKNIHKIPNDSRNLPL